MKVVLVISRPLHVSLGVREAKKTMQMWTKPASKKKRGVHSIASLSCPTFSSYEERSVHRVRRHAEGASKQTAHTGRGERKGGGGGGGQGGGVTSHYGHSKNLQPPSLPLSLLSTAAGMPGRRGESALSSLSLSLLRPSIPANFPSLGPFCIISSPRMERWGSIGAHTGGRREGGGGHICSPQYILTAEKRKPLFEFWRRINNVAFCCCEKGRGVR